MSEWAVRLVLNSGWRVRLWLRIFTAPELSGAVLFLGLPMSVIPEAVTKPCVYQNPLIIGGREYVIESDKTGRILDGNRLWPVSVAIAQIVAGMPIDELPFGREVTVCAVGDGLGLPGIVAASRGAVPVVVERDPRLWEFIHRNYIANQVWGRFRPFSWSEVIDVFDCAVGSEITYPGFGMSELCKFIDRCWNRKLPCYFGASSDSGSDEFMSGLETYRISVRRRLHDFQLPDNSAGVCYLWELTP